MSSDKTVEEKIDSLTSQTSFSERYLRVITELDALDSGQFDDTESKNVAALCLRAQLALAKAQATAEARAKMLKKDVEFEKANAYLRIKKDPPKEAGKLTEATLSSLVIADKNVNEIIKKQIEAEKQYREYSNILNILTNAHVTFRTLIKRGE